jgi:hypothetical protein
MSRNSAVNTVAVESTIAEGSCTTAAPSDGSCATAESEVVPKLRTTRKGRRKAPSRAIDR